jgi:IS4 transposase
LTLYRFRWQIEMAFKRMKSILALDEMAAKDQRLCRTFLLAKLLAALLVEDLARHAGAAFSPGGHGLPAPTFSVAAVESTG